MYKRKLGDTQNPLIRKKKISTLELVHMTLLLMRGDKQYRDVNRNINREIGNSEYIL